MADNGPMPWKVAEIVEATGGNLVCGELSRVFSGVSIDSRKTGSGDLFVAIRGEVHDGHAFLNQAADSGVRGFLVNTSKINTLPIDDWKAKEIVCVAVPDTTKALGALATRNRGRSTVRVVAITGSNGKTTTREMAVAVISQAFETLSPEKNFNNEIGLPLTLLALGTRHEIAVAELGMNHPGEIATLTKICLPDIGLITNIGPAHLEGVGSIEGVMYAKGELLSEIDSKGTVILNGDDARLVRLSQMEGYGKRLNNILLYGVAGNFPIRADHVEERPEGTRFRLATPGGTVPVTLGIHGRFMVSNALAAAAAGHVLGMAPEKIKAGLESFHPVAGRLNIFQTAAGVTVIDDTYNANPGSMSAAIETFQSLRKDSRGILAAGDMLELGSHSAELHYEIGKKAANSGITKLYITGNFAESVAAGAKAGGLKAEKIVTGNKLKIAEALKSTLRSGDWLLVKGSRGMRMEEIVEMIRNK